MDVGTPVFFRKIRVGEVVASELDASGEFVTIQVFVHAPHDARVSQGTRFWNASGVHVSVGASGVSVNVESLASLLIGGIAFDTPSGGRRARPRRDGTLFTLYESQAATRREIYHAEGALPGLLRPVGARAQGRARRSSSAASRSARCAT